MRLKEARVEVKGNLSCEALMAGWGCEVEGEGAEWTSRGGALRGCDCCGEGLSNLGGGLLPGGDLVQCTLHCVAVQKRIWRGTKGRGWEWAP